MKDNNSKLEDFLRNKLNDFTESNDGWDQPDPAIWKQAQQEISVYSKIINVSFDTLWKGGVLLLLLLSIGYSLFLQKEKQYLELELDKKAIEIKQKQKIATTEKILLEEKATLVAENEKLRDQNLLVSKQKIEFEKLTNQRQQTIYQLKKENQKLQSSLKNNALTTLNELAGQSNEEVQKTEKINKKPTLASEQNIAFLSRKETKLESPDLPKLNSLTPLISFKKNRKKFEVGYEYALLGLNLLVETGFDNFNKNISSNRIYAHANGFYFAYAPKKNLYIRTGFRTSSTTVQQNSKLSFEYDKSGEYIKQNGEIGNDLKMNTKTPFSDIKSDISVDIPQGIAIENGELIAILLSDNQELRYFQIPLGIEYFHGKGRWQWHLQGGMQWNQITFGDYTLKAEIYTKDNELPVDRIKDDSKSQPSKQYFSAYGGFGLNFQISEAWHVRTDLTYAYDFINNESKEFSNSQLFNNAFKLGLNYRF